MKQTGLTSRDKEWIPEYQKAVSSVIKSLGDQDEVMAEYGDLAKSWNETEPPEEIKRK